MVKGLKFILKSLFLIILDKFEDKLSGIFII